MSFGNSDQDFDRYRRQRIRHQRVAGEGDNPYENSALRELEAVEAREVRDQQLTREVHEFFASATKQAATIVERMAHDVVAEADVRVEKEMEAFLVESFARMNTLVLTMLQKRQGNGGEEKLEPNVNRIVGQALDGFRWEGTAELQDKHIGQDPFAIDLDDVRRELLDSCGDGDTRGQDGAAPIAEHLVAAVEPQFEEVAEPIDTEPALDVERVDDESRPTPAPAAAVSGREDELERMKQALKSLVRQGTMTRDEARAAWAKRLESLGLTPIRR